jgi:hypothetical protein
MNHRDIAAIIKGIAPVVRDFVSEQVKGFGERLAVIEQRAPEKGDKGDPGLPGSDGKDGASIAIDDIIPVVAEQVQKAVAGLPVAKDGVAGSDGIDGQPGKDGIDGKDAAPVKRDDILAAIKSDPTIIADAVAEYLKVNPPPSGRDGINGKDGLDGKEGPVGKSGADVAGALIDRDGNLVLTLSDGKALSLGVVVGKDGAPGKDGLAGRDGFGFDDLEAEHDGERALTLRFVRGDAKKEFTFTVPAVIDRGVWKEGQFKAGDGVSWDGSWFVAQTDTDKKPGTPESGWRLCAKRGRDGASAFDMAKRAGFKGGEGEWRASLRGPIGPEGRPGRDLTQLGFDGSKR